MVVDTTMLLHISVCTLVYHTYSRYIVAHRYSYTSTYVHRLIHDPVGHRPSLQPASAAAETGPAESPARSAGAARLPPGAARWMRDPDRIHMLYPWYHTHVIIINLIINPSIYIIIIYYVTIM